MPYINVLKKLEVGQLNAIDVNTLFDWTPKKFSIPFIIPISGIVNIISPSIIYVEFVRVQKESFTLSSEIVIDPIEIRGERISYIECEIGVNPNLLGGDVCASINILN
jgi:hypothetical protein